MDWPKDMQPTGKSFVGIKDGKAVAIAMQFTGKRGDRLNRESLVEFAKAGYDVQTLPDAEAVLRLQRDA